MYDNIIIFDYGYGMRQYEDMLSPQQKEHAKFYGKYRIFIHKTRYIKELEAINRNHPQSGLPFECRMPVEILLGSVVVMDTTSMLCFVYSDEEGKVSLMPIKREQEAEYRELGANELANMKASTIQAIVSTM